MHTVHASVRARGVVSLSLNELYVCFAGIVVFVVVFKCVLSVLELEQLVRAVCGGC